jgi:hypothetical protein
LFLLIYDLKQKGKPFRKLLRSFRESRRSDSALNKLIRGGGVLTTRLRATLDAQVKESITVIKALEEVRSARESIFERVSHD